MECEQVREMTLANRDAVFLFAHCHKIAAEKSHLRTETSNGKSVFALQNRTCFFTNCNQVREMTLANRDAVSLVAHCHKIEAEKSHLRTETAGAIRELKNEQRERAKVRICIYICMYLCVCIYIYIYTHTYTYNIPQNRGREESLEDGNGGCDSRVAKRTARTGQGKHTFVCIYMFVYINICVYACMHVCMYVCIYMYICIYINS